MHEYGVLLTKFENISNADCIIVAVAHKEFKELDINKIKGLFRNGPDENKVLIDVKGLYCVDDLKRSKMKWWRL